MAPERKDSIMSGKSRSSRFGTGDDGILKEYAWACELKAGESEETSEHTWDFQEEDEDEDYLMHTLYVRLAVLGKGAKAGERQIVVAETKDYNEKPVTMTFVNLTGGEGKADMVNIDLNFQGVIPVTFRLVEGKGPIHLCGQHTVEWPADEQELGDTVLEYTEDETDHAETEEEKTKGKGAKRKNDAPEGGKQKQRGKLDTSAASPDDDEDAEEDDDEEEEDMEEADDAESEEEEEEEPESSPEKPKQKGKAKKKAGAAPAKPAAKAKEAKGPVGKKAGKKGKNKC